MIQSILTEEISKLSISQGATISAKATEAISAKAVDLAKSKENEFGVKLLGLEIREFFLLDTPFTVVLRRK